MFYVRINKNAARLSESQPLPQVFYLLLSPVLVLFIFVIMLGGIYVAIFTPTEGAAVGSGLTGLYAVLTGRLGLAQIRECILNTANTMAMMLLTVPFFLPMILGLYFGLSLEEAAI